MVYGTTSDGKTLVQSRRLIFVEGKETMDKFFGLPVLDNNAFYFPGSAECFKIIVDFMSNGDKFVLRANLEVVTELQKLASFFGLPLLRQMCIFQYPGLEKEKQNEMSTDARELIPPGIRITQTDKTTKVFRIGAREQLEELEKQRNEHGKAKKRMESEVEKNVDSGTNEKDGTHIRQYSLKHKMKRDGEKESEPKRRRWNSAL